MPYPAEIVEAEDADKGYYVIRPVEARHGACDGMLWSNDLYLTQLEAVAEWQARLSAEIGHWQAVLDQAYEYAMDRVAEAHNGKMQRGLRATHKR